MKKEQWKIIEECPIYLISNTGKVKNLKYLKTKKYYLRRGYKRIDLYDAKNKRCLKRSVHRLVAENFIPNPLNKPQVNHIDGDKLNNNIENLEWATAQENTAHAIGAGLTDSSKTQYLKGEEISSSKITEEEVIKLREMYDSGEFILRELSEHFDLSIATVWHITKRNTWKHI